MTCYLLVLSQDGEESYSLWTTKESAKSEMKYMVNNLQVFIEDINIIEVDLLD